MPLGLSDPLILYSFPHTSLCNSWSAKDSVLKGILVFTKWSLCKSLPWPRTALFHSGAVAPTSAVLIVTLMFPPKDPASCKFILAFVTVESLAIAYKRSGSGQRPLGELSEWSYLKTRLEVLTAWESQPWVLVSAASLTTCMMRQVIEPFWSLAASSVKWSR